MNVDEDESKERVTAHLFYRPTDAGTGRPGRLYEGRRSFSERLHQLSPGLLLHSFNTH